jgi:REP element-mobilizing transposase RayT
MKKKSVNYYALFEPNDFYHVYNRTNNKETLFVDEEDSLLFLSLYWELLEPFVHTYAYCLMGNHFHLAIGIKSEWEIVKIIENIPFAERTVVQKAFLHPLEEELVPVHKVIEAQFTRLFTIYAIRFNTKYQRNGNLFHRPFKRIQITSEDYLVWLIYYIHSNPLKHKIQKDFWNYPWSSYQTILSTTPTPLNRKDVLDWFIDIERFKKFHLPEWNMPAHAQLWQIEEA